MLYVYIYIYIQLRSVMGHLNVLDHANVLDICVIHILVCMILHIKKSTQIYHDIFTPFVCADTSQGILKVHKFISGTSMLADTRARMTRQDH